MRILTIIEKAENSNYFYEKRFNQIHRNYSKLEKSSIKSNTSVTYIHSNCVTCFQGFAHNMRPCFILEIFQSKTLTALKLFTYVLNERKIVCEVSEKFSTDTHSARTRSKRFRTVCLKFLHFRTLLDIIVRANFGTHNTNKFFFMPLSYCSASPRSLISWFMRS